MGDRPFLRARWEDLAMVNYRVPDDVLEPYVPAGTELDHWNGHAYASLVGFRFLGTRVKGIPLPMHGSFEEVNLRFYVKRDTGDEIRRGVVFVKEIVPKPAVTLVARALYGENYVTMPMRHWIGDDHGSRGVEYSWRHRRRWNRMRFRTQGDSAPLAGGSEEEFITEHYWGYAKGRRGTTEYQVQHPPWNVWRATDVVVECAIAAIYGEAFDEALSAAPASAFVADGSEVAVFGGRRIHSR